MDQVDNDLCLNEALRHIEDKTTTISDAQVSETEPRLLPEQKDIYNKILQRVELGECDLFFLTPLGGTAVTSSGIAATLLSGGRTAHSLFKLPLNLTSAEIPTCNISKSSSRGALLKQWNFRQTLPVIERGTAADEINACQKASYLWSKIEKLYLTTNIGVQLFSDVESRAYAQKLLEIGGGHLHIDQEVMTSDNTTSYPVEFLNSLELSGVPSHKLELKASVPVLLMRNLDAPRLCNGTRLRVTELGRHIVKATILTGEAKGDNVLTPRIPIIPNNLPFNFKHLQFLLKVAFSMTINESQGQTLKVAGIHLDTPCFSHGQPYVACSRVSKAKNLHVYTERKKSLNIVYRSILQ
ncbi:ATP-dependent DNA helicase PIF6 [Eumeta japonica]|uniref:ATP-dependent DNA helicase n=1 Tax=Eumeta variegata TaxID=151549 RepID=A0A4C1VDL7_EUMVA|nr:ATP-dependent DNA helicase PIF6 [Eumeta japonica]